MSPSQRGRGQPPRGIRALEGKGSHRSETRPPPLCNHPPRLNKWVDRASLNISRLRISAGKEEGDNLPPQKAAGGAVSPQGLWAEGMETSSATGMETQPGLGGVWWPAGHRPGLKKRRMRRKIRAGATLAWAAGGNGRSWHWGGPGQDRLLLPVLSRLSFFLLWSTSTVPTR